MLMQIVQGIVLSSAGVTAESLDRQFAQFRNSLSKETRYLIVIVGLVIFKFYTGGYIGGPSASILPHQEAMLFNATHGNL